MPLACLAHRFWHFYIVSVIHSFWVKVGTNFYEKLLQEGGGNHLDINNDQCFTGYLKYFGSWNCYKTVFSVLFFCRINNKMFEKESYERSDCWGQEGRCPSSQCRWWPCFVPHSWTKLVQFPRQTTTSVISCVRTALAELWTRSWVHVSPAWHQERLLKSFLILFVLSAVTDSLLEPTEFSFSDSLLSTCNCC